jgi:tRNA pseudouridine55 synthase
MPHPQMMNNWNGWFVLDKPHGMSSNDALQKVRRHFGKVKAGHAGTLDPLATGILPIALGEATKVIPFAMDHTKTYVFDVEWGEERTTDDAEGDISHISSVRPTQQAIESILSSFVGAQLQTPPLYSAIKLQGKRACDRVRKGEDVTLSPRTIAIHGLCLLNISSPNTACFEVVCGKGTYVRSLARDIGRALGTAAHITALRRTRVGPFRESQAHTLEKVLEMQDHCALKEAVYSVDIVLDDIPVIILTDPNIDRLRKGQRLTGADIILDDSTEHPTGTVFRCYDTHGIFHALAHFDQNILSPYRVLNYVKE